MANMEAILAGGLERAMGQALGLGIAACLGAAVLLMSAALLAGILKPSAHAATRTKRQEGKQWQARP